MTLELTNLLFGYLLQKSMRYNALLIWASAANFRMQASVCMGLRFILLCCFVVAVSGVSSVKAPNFGDVCFSFFSCARISVGHRAIVFYGHCVGYLDSLWFHGIANVLCLYCCRLLAIALGRMIWTQWIAPKQKHFGELDNKKMFRRC